MIKDFFVSFSDNFKEKVKNPFLGTYLLVWLIRNWDLVYTIFNFDDGTKLNEKVNFITNYYSKNEFIVNLFSNAGWSLLLLIITYILVNISRFIVNFSEKQLTPWVYKKTDSSSVVLVSTYKAVRANRDRLQVRLDEEKESNSKLQIKIKALEDEITSMKSMKPDPLNFDYYLNKEEKPNKDEFNDPSSILLKKIKDKNLINDFVQMAVKITK